MLHAQSCTLCGKENEFYDESLQVDPAINAQVLAKIQAIYPPSPDERRISDPSTATESEKPQIGSDDPTCPDAQLPQNSTVEESKDTRVNSDENTEAAGDNEEDEDQEDQFETHWKCWKCKKIFQLSDSCVKCRLSVSDYEGDVNVILFEVKVSDPKRVSSREPE